MADEDLMFRMEGLDNSHVLKDHCSDYSKADSDEEDNYIICPITEDPSLHHETNNKKTRSFGSLTKETQYGTSSSPRTSFSFKEAWKHAIQKAKQMPDPWAEFHLEDIEAEHAIRHRYNVVSGQWVQDDVLIKMASQPFGRGAMRECYRMKKRSNFSHKQLWKNAYNYVAKRYLETVDRDVYFEDVRLQMEAKLWGEEYNRHKPPKQVDIMQMCIIEMIDRPGKPLYHLEHYIEGKYIKYNSNSGFVRDENIRLTPQAFSHFTFERSGHQLIVVDIQGVGDLYTDPQIHTQSGTDFGDGNLGVRGMALFFHSHACNRICKSMRLTPFDLSAQEKIVLDNCSKLLQSAQTVVRGIEEKCGSSRVRTMSGSRPPLLSRFSENSGDENMSDRTFDSLPNSPSPLTPQGHRFDVHGWPIFNEVDNLGSEEDNNLDNRRDSENGGDSGCPSEKRSESDEMEHRIPVNYSRRRMESESEDSFGKSKCLISKAHVILKNSPRSNLVTVEKWNQFHASRVHIHRSSCVAVEVQRLNDLEIEKKIGKSILGKVHLAMVRYHEAGRFCDKDQDWDQESAIFHLEHAARCGELEAIIGLGLMYSQLPHHILTEVSVQDTEENRIKGFNYLLMAAEAGDRPSMIHIARAYDTGINLGKDSRLQNWQEAIFWYNSALNMTDYDEGGEYDGTQDEPKYLLLAREAEMLLTGGFELEKDPQRSGDLYTEAAEAAMEAMKGRLANQYYQKAEEAWALMEE
ncbi:eukaryotic elongation factor 2 kinase isoform X2 [Pseudophryne corroboree]|uniref:eukaryotic elongation factor 2 kinase isoform X2 n=1 Tax=Pseudophryne corroboree TaxID=495146 RepID=UPI003081CA31